MEVILKDGRSFKLGRLRPAARPQCVRLGSFFDRDKMAAAPPDKIDYAAKAMAGIKKVYLNDSLGCCVISDSMHSLDVWYANDNAPMPLASDAEVSSAYRTICGPGDNGCYITAVLDYQKARGITAGGKLHKIDGYVSVDWTDKLEVQVALLVFGGLRLGIDLPSAWTCTDCVWDTTSSRIVGGHDVRAIGYDSTGVQVSTWGGIATITWAAFLSTRWLSECYAELAPAWYGSDKLAPNGIDAQALVDALAMIEDGDLPPIDPTPIPPGPVPPVPPGPVPPPPVPPAPPAPPIPSTWTVTFPRTRVEGGIFQGFYVPAVTLQGRLAAAEAGVDDAYKLVFSEIAIAIAPLVPILVDAYLNSNKKDEAGNLVRAPLPPWVTPVLQLLCSQAGRFPPPWGTLLMIACGFIPMTGNTPCGCK